MLLSFIRPTSVMGSFLNELQVHCGPKHAGKPPERLMLTEPTFWEMCSLPAGSQALPHSSLWSCSAAFPEMLAASHESSCLSVPSSQSLHYEGRLSLHYEGRCLSTTQEGRCPLHYTGRCLLRRAVSPHHTGRAVSPLRRTTPLSPSSLLPL